MATRQPGTQWAEVVALDAAALIRMCLAIEEAEPAVVAPSMGDFRKTS
jgi:hypothetical protein